jgi:hypothetical protein
MEKKRLVYEPPRARDLSAPSVSGQKPLGNCGHGQVAEIGQCTPVGGTDAPSDCRVGGTASDACDAGFSAAGGPAPNCAFGSWPGPGQCGVGNNP